MWRKGYRVTVASHVFVAYPVGWYSITCDKCQHSSEIDASAPLKKKKSYV